MNIQNLVGQVLGNYNLNDVVKTFNSIPNSEKQRIMDLISPYVSSSDISSGINVKTILGVYNKIPAQNKQEILSIVQKYLPVSQLGSLTKYVPTTQLSKLFQ